MGDTVAPASDTGRTFVEPEARQRVLGAVLDYPGLHVRGIARLLDLAPSHVEYHADGLVDAELITEASYAGYRRFYPRPGPAAPALADSETLALLREPVPLHILLLLIDAGPLPHGALAEKVPVAKSTLSFHLTKLVEAKVLTKGDSHAYGIRDPDHLHRLVICHRPEPELLAKHWELWIRVYRSG